MNIWHLDCRHKNAAANIPWYGPGNFYKNQVLIFDNPTITEWLIEKYEDATFSTANAITCLVCGSECVQCFNWQKKCRRAPNSYSEKGYSIECEYELMGMGAGTSGYCPFGDKLYWGKDKQENEIYVDNPVKQ